MSLGSPVTDYFCLQMKRWRSAVFLETESRRTKHLPLFTSFSHRFLSRISSFTSICNIFANSPLQKNLKEGCISPSSPPVMVNNWCRLMKSPTNNLSITFVLCENSVPHILASLKETNFLFIFIDEWKTLVSRLEHRIESDSTQRNGEIKVCS